MQLNILKQASINKEISMKGNSVCNVCVCWVAGRHSSCTVLHSDPWWPLFQPVDHPSHQVHVLLYGRPCRTSAYWLGSAVHRLSTGRPQWIPAALSLRAWTHQHWCRSVHLTLPCSLTHIQLFSDQLIERNKLHCSTERDSRLAHYFALFLGVGLCLGYLATSGAKSDVIFLLSNPDFLNAWWNFACMSHSFLDLTWDRQTNRWQTTDAATETEGCHTVSVWA